MVKQFVDDIFSEEEAIEVKTLKGTFVPVETEFIMEWMGLLEKECKGITAWYIALQKYIHRGDIKGMSDKAFPSHKILAELSGMCLKTSHKAKDVLVKYGFIQYEQRMNGSKSNVYMILPIPKFVEDTGVKQDIVPVQTDVFFKPVEGIELDLRMDQKDKAKGLINELLKRKAIETFNTNDMIRFYKLHYKSIFGIPDINAVTGRERGSIKKLIDDEGARKVYDMIVYTLDNWSSIPYLVKLGYPSINILYGYKNSLLPESQVGKIKRIHRGQADPDKSWKGVTEW